MGLAQTNSCEWLSEKFRILPVNFGGFSSLEYLASFSSIFMCSKKFTSFITVFKCSKHISDHLLLENFHKLLAEHRMLRTKFQDDDGKLLLRSNANEFV